jgi:hypothetical protein
MLVSRCVFSRSANARRAQSRRPALELFEDRTAPAVFTVTSPDDTIAVDGAVTLREAITAANINAPSGDAPAGDPGLDTIRFDLPSSSTRIDLRGPIDVTDPAVIDGTTQPGFSGMPLVSLTGGVFINAGGSTVRGLSIDGVFQAPIVIEGAGGNHVVGNVLTANNLNLGGPGEGDGVLIVNSVDNVIGGTTAADGNTIRGDGAAVVSIFGAGSTGNQVLGNVIGGTSSGIDVSADGNFIGGSAPGAGNVISKNNGDGVILRGSNNVVEGNRIGTDPTGTFTQANAGNGVTGTGTGNGAGGRDLFVP